MSKMGSKGWRSGESARLLPIWPGFRKSWRRLHTCIEFVVGSLLCSERFFSGYSGFPLSSKTNISKFQFDQESGTRKLMKNYFVDVLPLNIYCRGATVGSEQQHNHQDLREIYEGRRILEFITFYHNALQLTTLFTTMHCI